MPVTTEHSAPPSGHLLPLEMRCIAEMGAYFSTYPLMRLGPPVPTTAIFSRSDGVVAWQGCREQAGPLTEGIEVEGSQTGMGHNPAVLHAVANRLAMSEGQSRPFDRSGAKSFMYRDPYRE